MAAVSLTRYPPGLVTALEKMNQSTTAVRGASPAIAHLWLVPPGGALEERIGVLREL
jgi:heat shock protein HtpX